jgi:hypothetical protein
VPDHFAITATPAAVVVSSSTACGVAARQVGSVITVLLGHELLLHWSTTHADRSSSLDEKRLHWACGNAAESRVIVEIHRLGELRVCVLPHSGVIDGVADDLRAPAHERNSDSQIQKLANAAVPNALE